MNSVIPLLALALGGSGALFCLLAPSSADRLLRSAAAYLGEWIRRVSHQPGPRDLDLELTSRIAASLRAGISLDSALEQASQEPDLPLAVRARIRRILDRRPEADFLSAFLASALATGIPALAALGAFQKALATRRRLLLKAKAATGQSRAQAEVLSWLPWAMACGLFFLDPAWLFTAGKSPFAWLLWSIAIGLTGAGRWWIRHSLARSLAPRSPAERLEEEALPDFILRLLAELSLGTDMETALERGLAAQNDPALRAAFAGTGSAISSPERASALRGLLHHASRTGAPVRDDLLAFLQDLQFELESRWEERVQRLPVSLLAPLFACFFPGSLLVMLGLLLPVLWEVW